MMYKLTNPKANSVHFSKLSSREITPRDFALDLNKIK